MNPKAATTPTAYLKDQVLPSDFEAILQNLGKIVRNSSRKRIVNWLVKNLTLEMPASPRTGAGISLANRRIVLPEGFLGARWCSTYRTLGLLKGSIGFAAFQNLSPIGAVFGWPADVPTPDDPSDAVATVNKIYPYVILATVLHEIGHITHREHRVFGARLELACDAFAIDYLARSVDGENQEFLSLALALWICSLCTESLMFTVHNSRLYPSPARRMEQLFSRHLSRFGKRQTREMRLL